jgi:hypothetical protein
VFLARIDNRADDSKTICQLRRRHGVMLPTFYCEVIDSVTRNHTFPQLS